MKKLLLLKTIFLIALSGCAGKFVADVQTVNVNAGLVNHRKLTFDNKNCSMTSQFIRSENIGPNQQGLICVTPENFNKGFVKWQDEQCN